LGRWLRLYNLSKLGIEPESKNLDEVIYELTFMKFYTKVNPFVIYTKCDLNKKIDSNKILQEKTVSYAFGPYDIAILSKNTTNEIDTFLSNIKNDFTFFTERHALFLLDIIGEVNPKVNNCFDLCISIDVKNEFSQKTDNFFKEFKESIKDLRDNFKSAKIFVSMGNENYIVYIQNITIDKIDTITLKLYENEHIKSISTTVLLNNNYKNQMENLEISNRNIILLCKVKKNGRSHSQALKEIEKVFEGDKFKNVKVYKKYGVYDLLILFDDGASLQKVYDLIKKINKYVYDIQFEFQNQCNDPSKTAHSCC